VFVNRFAMDGVREAIYDGKPVADYKAGELNRIASEAAVKPGLPFIDLQDTFARHYAAKAKRFEYSYDWHWNALGNQLVGKRIADFLLAKPA